MQSRDIRFMSGTERPSCDGYDADVVILALDRVDETIAAIHSALGQTGVSRHVTIVDQGSQPEALTRLAATVYGRTDATLVALEHNHGVPGGRNIGAALGRGRIIVGLDNDAIFDASDMLARIVAAFDADPNLGALGCRIVVDSTGDDDLSSWGYPAALLPRSRNSFEAVTFVGAGHAIRRETWDDAGGYDAVSYTHLDVYKRQVLGWSNVCAAVHRMNLALSRLTQRSTPPLDCSLIALVRISL